MASLTLISRFHQESCSMHTTKSSVLYDLSIIDNLFRQSKIHSTAVEYCQTTCPIQLSEDAMISEGPQYTKWSHHVKSWQPWSFIITVKLINKVMKSARTLGSHICKQAIDAIALQLWSWVGQQLLLTKFHNQPLLQIFCWEMHSEAKDWGLAPRKVSQKLNTPKSGRKLKDQNGCQSSWQVSGCGWLREVPHC